MTSYHIWIQIEGEIYIKIHVHERNWGLVPESFDSHSATM